MNGTASMNEGANRGWEPLAGAVSGAVPRMGFPGPAQRVRVVTPAGLSLIGAVKISQAAETFQCRVRVAHGRAWADARDILGLLSLGVGAGGILDIEAEGDGAVEAVRSLATLTAGTYGVEKAREAGQDARGNTLGKRKRRQ